MANKVQLKLKFEAMKSFLLCLVFILSGLSAYAHPPKSVELSYDAEKGELNISVVHPVKDVKSHYIKDVIISLNGEEKELIKYEKQSDSETFSFTYQIAGLKGGDVINVVADCNKFGKRSAELVID